MDELLIREVPLKYRTIVADPPWDIGDFPPNFGYEAGKRCPYPTMSLDEIKALPVKALANNRDADAHLYLWTTAGYLKDAYDVVEAWGFEPMYPLVWCKPPFGLGLGGKFTSNVEFILFCRRPGYVSIDRREPRLDIAAITARIGEITVAAGFTTRDLNALVGASDIASWWTSALPLRCAIPKPEHWETLKAAIPALAELDDGVHEHNERKGRDRTPSAPLEGRCDTRWFTWPRGRHSEKPEAFLDLVEQMSPAPRVELFARRARFGWDYWGDESLGTAELVSAGGLDEREAG